MVTTFPSVGCRLLLAVVLLLLVAPAHAEEDPTELFRIGMQAFRDGRCEAAVENLGAALSLDTDLHSARQPLAECYYKLGVTIGAIQHLQVYIKELPDGPEKERATATLDTYREELAAMAGLTVTKEPEVEEAVAVVPVTPPPTASGPPLVSLEIAGGVSHFFTSLEPTFGELALGVRVRPARRLALGVGGGLGLGSGPDLEGTIRLPQLRMQAGFLPVIQPVELLLGAEVLLLGSRVGDVTGVDPGALFLAECRGPLGDSALFIGGAFTAGYAVQPVVGGRLVLGITLARRRGVQ